MERKNMQPPNPQSYLQLVELAIREDLGSGDITSQATIPAGQQGVGSVVFRQSGILCGIPIVEEVLRCYDGKLTFSDAFEDGREISGGAVVVRIAGRLRSILAAERVVLNFLQRLSAIATITAHYVKAVDGTKVKIYDTRKTTPGWRELEKYAVRCGGGHNHRRGLYDAVLIKDNHLAAMGELDLQEALTEAVKKIRSGQSQPDFIQVETDTLEQLRIVLQVEGVDIVLLDNMGPAMLREAVMIRDEISGCGRVELEASGGITLENVRSIAETGVERISIGALTHSVANLDIGLDLES